MRHRFLIWPTTVACNSARAGVYEMAAEDTTAIYNRVCYTAIKYMHKYKNITYTDSAPAVLYPNTAPYVA